MTKSQKKTLKVVTLNAWLLRTPVGLDLAKDIDLRARCIPGQIARLGADIVLLQEVWHPTLQEILRKDFEKRGYPYSSMRKEESLTLDRRDFLKRFALSIPKGLRDISHSIMKDGLMVFSRFEIKEDIQKLIFSRYTRPDEAYVEKGAIKTQVLLPELGWVDIFNAHLGAVSFDADTQTYNAREVDIRTFQTVELSNWLQKNQSSDFAIVGGDFNSHYRAFSNGAYKEEISEEFALMTSQSNAGLKDSYTECNGMQEGSGYTDHSQNSYRKSGHFAKSPDAVLDYLFYTPLKYLKAVSSELIFDKHCLSDHYGVLSTFAF